MTKTITDYEARWNEVALTPSGTVQLVVLRTGGGAHETPEQAELSPEQGVHGDRWSQGDEPDPTCQVTLMHVEAARVVAGDRPLHLPGDNFLVDMDLSEEALPVGARVRIGEALLEVTPTPHLGCGKFADRFGPEALKWINAKAHRARRLRGVNCRVVEGGRVALGDAARPE